MLTYKTVSGKDILVYLDDLARLRIQVFREWPYLYEGDFEYEKKYIATFARAAGAVLVLAIDSETDQVVGASTGLPMQRETWNIQKPFRGAGYDVKTVFYFSESVLLPEYRGRGAGVHFFKEREAWARHLGGFELLTFCGVVRPDNHHLRPPDFQPLDEFWRRRGFEKAEGLVCHIFWQDVDETKETSKPLQFWIKYL